MQYKGFIIEPVYSVCADWHLTADGRIVPRKPKSSDIEYYVVLDPTQNNSRFFAEFTIAECKSEIDRILLNIGLKCNA